MPVDTRSLVALSDLAARHRAAGDRPADDAARGRRRVAGLAAASVGAGLVCGLVVPVEGAALAAAPSSPAHRATAVVVPAVLLGSGSSPFAVVVRPRAAAPTKPGSTAAKATAAKATAAKVTAAKATAAKATLAGGSAVPATPSTVPATTLTLPPTAVGPSAPALQPATAVSSATVAAPPQADPIAPRGGTALAPRRADLTAAAATGAPAYVPRRPLPARSGSGRRIVYSERAAHLWVVGADGLVIRDYAVTGRVGRPKPGVYRVYSKSTVAINPGERLRFEYMVRFAYGITGARIGFHTIPRYYDGVPIQQESQLGRAIGAGGCVRQSRADAQWLYAWSRVGDTVVVRL